MPVVARYFNSTDSEAYCDVLDEVLAFLEEKLSFAYDKRESSVVRDVPSYINLKDEYLRIRGTPEFVDDIGYLVIRTSNDWWLAEVAMWNEDVRNGKAIGASYEIAVKVDDAALAMELKLKFL